MGVAKKAMATQVVGSGAPKGYAGGRLGGAEGYGDAGGRLVHWYRAGALPRHDLGCYGAPTGLGWLYSANHDATKLDLESGYAISNLCVGKLFLPSC